MSPTSSEVSPTGSEASPTSPETIPTNRASDSNASGGDSDSPVIDCNKRGRDSDRHADDSNFLVCNSDRHICHANIPLSRNGYTGAAKWSAAFRFGTAFPVRHVSLDARSVLPHTKFCIPCSARQTAVLGRFHAKEPSDVPRPRSQRRRPGTPACSKRIGARALETDVGGRRRRH